MNYNMGVVCFGEEIRNSPENLTWVSVSVVPRKALYKIPPIPELFFIITSWIRRISCSGL
jgi:hypothetical protein